MAKIKWNEYTWYSRLLALILFIIFLPILTFYIGIRYQQTVDILNSTSVWSVPTSTTTMPGNPVTPVTPTQPVTVSTTTPVGGSTGGSISSSYTITNADMGKTLVFKKGQSFEVGLGSDLNWSVRFSPVGIVTQRIIPLPSSVQGFYTATEVGTTQLSATGAPRCNPNQACPDFLVEVNVTIQVTN